MKRQLEIPFEAEEKRAEQEAKLINKLNERDIRNLFFVALCILGACIIGC